MRSISIATATGLLMVLGVGALAAVTDPTAWKEPKAGDVVCPDPFAPYLGGSDDDTSPSRGRRGEPDDSTGPTFPPSCTKVAAIARGLPPMADHRPHPGRGTTP